jgi:hypothetical protein
LPHPQELSIVRASPFQKRTVPLVLISCPIINYNLKSGRAIGILKLMTSGKSIGAGVWSESKPHLLNRLNYVPWDVPPNRSELNHANERVAKWVVRHIVKV